MDKNAAKKLVVEILDGYNGPRPKILIRLVYEGGKLRQELGDFDFLSQFKNRSILGEGGKEYTLDDPEGFMRALPYAYKHLSFYAVLHDDY